MDNNTKRILISASIILAFGCPEWAYSMDSDDESRSSKSAPKNKTSKRKKKETSFKTKKPKEEKPIPPTPAYDVERGMYHFGPSLSEIRILDRKVKPLEDKPDTGTIYPLSPPEGEEPVFALSLIPEGESVLGKSDRRKLIKDCFSHPWCTFGRLAMTFDSADGRKAKYVGSGTLIRPNFVLTAAHNLYDHKMGLIPTNVTFYLALDEDKHLGVAYATEMFVHYKYIHLSPENDVRDADIGLIKLNKSLGEGKDFLPLHQLEDAVLGDKKKGKAPLFLSVAGYPGTLRYMFGMEGELMTYTPHRLFYDIDTSGGQSGSAICIKAKSVDKKDSYEIVGVHSYGGTAREGNSGTRLTKDNYSLINYWMTKP